MALTTPLIPLFLSSLSSRDYSGVAPSEVSHPVPAVLPDPNLRLFTTPGHTHNITHDIEQDSRNNQR